ncbi:SWIM zinc finger family protein [Rhodococcus sp. H29-C3]|uniref:SWIM zinc finger family protein n=1 Tax=Rhodococcus sp. H29-C3 TaxID=3046307 RepID=UPI0024BA022F|nr:SWIM zinc finger family protein [Rhodococcus sp. H29-C3]MDJ0363185.1 SWIM zinc finger family protein [Rhodococcus sp. H29-C3]
MTIAEFGATIWGRDWVRLAEPMQISKPNPRLPKARSLARNGHVEIGPLAAGTIRCAVTAGSTTETVSISIPSYLPDEIRAVTALQASADAIEAKGGDLPDTLHAQLAEGELSAVPSTADCQCTCRSRAQPCVHKLATFYVLSQRIDEKPSLALELRGIATVRELPSRTALCTERWAALTKIDMAYYFSTSSVERSCNSATD